MPDVPRVRTAISGERLENVVTSYSPGSTTGAWRNARPNASSSKPIERRGSKLFFSGDDVGTIPVGMTIGDFVIYMSEVNE